MIEDNIKFIKDEIKNLSELTEDDVHELDFIRVKKEISCYKQELARWQKLKDFLLSKETEYGSTYQKNIEHALIMELLGKD